MPWGPTEVSASSQELARSGRGRKILHLECAPSSKVKCALTLRRATKALANLSTKWKGLLECIVSAYSHDRPEPMTQGKPVQAQDGLLKEIPPSESFLHFLSKLDQRSPTLNLSEF